MQAAWPFMIMKKKNELSKMFEKKPKSNEQIEDDWKKYIRLRKQFRDGGVDHV